MRVAIISGHRWSGKSTMCENLRGRGAHWINLDPVYTALAQVGRIAGKSIMTSDRASLFDLFRSTFSILLPPIAPSVIVTDGMMYGEDPQIALAFAASLAKYNAPLYLKFYKIDLQEDEIMRRYGRVRASIIASEGQAGLARHNLENFVVHHPRYADFFEPIVDIEPVLDFLQLSLGPDEVI